LTDFNLTFVGPRGESAADLARRLGLVASTATDIEALMAALNRRVAVAAAAVVNVNVAAAPAAVDGVTLTSGQLILLPAQTVPAENGVYVFAGAGAALVRWTGADAWYELPALVVGVQGGATHANSAWQCFNEQGGILGTTAVTFLKLASSLNALLALSNTWTSINTFGAGLNVTGDRLRVATTSNLHGAAAAVDHTSLVPQVVVGPHYNGGTAYNTGDRRLEVSAWTGRPQLRLARHNINNITLAVESDGSATWSDGVGERLRVSAGNFRPGADATQSLGGASFRWSTVYAATGTINTSDATEKTEFAPIPPGVAAAARALMGRIGVYQWLASVAEKGADKARLHIGLKAQDVRDAFLDEGEDPARWGLFCEDAVLVPVTRTRTVERPVLEQRTRAQEIIVVEDGVAVQRIVEERAEEPVFDLVPVVDEAGQPVLRQVTATDEKGEPVILQEPLLHAVAVTETVEETYEVMEPTGETRLGLRHEQLLMLFLAVLAEGG